LRATPSFYIKIYRPGTIEINLLAMEQPEKRNREEVSKVAIIETRKNSTKKRFQFLEV